MKFEVLYSSNIPTRYGYGLPSQITFDDGSIGLFLVTHWLQIGEDMGGLFPINSKGHFLGENMIPGHLRFGVLPDVVEYVENNLYTIFNDK